jgi:hypothetical protein
MREDLLGYLLNALDDAERQRVFEALQKDPQLRQELESLRHQLRRLDATNVDFEPPAALAELTCDLVEGYAEERPLAAPAKRQTRSVGWARVRSAACETCFPSGTWSAADTIVMAGVLLAVSLLFFPAIAGSRYRAQITACGDNLRNLGIALAGYSEQHQGFFPSIPVSGNRSVAGIYAVLLAESERLENPRILLCPGSRWGTQRADFRTPTLAELDQARGPQLFDLQRDMGGDYAYSLGTYSDGYYRPPRHLLRERFALLADAPSLHLPGRQSGNHWGRGQSVMFGDLHVEFLSTPEYEPLGDDVYRNRQGFAEAAADEFDSVLGASNARPLIY